MSQQLYLLITEYQSVNYKLCFLSDEELFSLTVDLIKTILAAFILHLLRHEEKTNFKGEPAMYCSLDYSKFFETICITIANIANICCTTNMKTKLCGRVTLEQLLNSFQCFQIVFKFLIVKHTKIVDAPVPPTGLYNWTVGFIVSVSWRYPKLA